MGNYESAAARPQVLACPSCRGSNGATARFCQNCGTSLAPKPCRQCGTTLETGAKFCGQCGTSSL